MNFLARLITTALIAALAFVAVPAAAHADEPVPACQYDEADVRALQLDLIEAEHEATTLRDTLVEERDEHADELRHRDRVAWETQQAHDAEVNEYSAIARDAQDALRDAQQDAQETIVQRDLQILRLQSKVQRLRDRLQSR
jgi:hypothetical protein